MKLFLTFTVTIINEARPLLLKSQNEIYLVQIVKQYKMKNLKRIAIALFFVTYSFGVYAQTPPKPNSKREVVLAPKVFLLTQGDIFDDLSVEYEGSLLNAAGEDMNQAYTLWMHMMNAMQQYSDEVKYDIKGTKLMMRVFFGEDGAVHHIAYYPRTESRNFKFDEMTAFLREFIKRYKMPVNYGKKFSHYGIGRFPVTYIPANTPTATKSGN